MKKFKVQYVPDYGLDWETDYSTNSRKKALKYAKKMAKMVDVDAVRVIKAERIFRKKSDKVFDPGFPRLV